MATPNGSGLANQALLNKIDKLRELNVKSIGLPQIVVVGDQSSGKSSVLESLTGFSFPHAPGLCTRYATQISCRREQTKGVTVSIIPRQDADDERANRIRSFRKNVSDLSNDALAGIIKQANTIMGIRMNANDTTPGLQTFSEDILKIEITGPEEQHLTVIDVPGIFYVPSPPLTTETDKMMVRNMVQTYMNNKRTIILAILPSNADIATQDILTMAEEADEEGVRTMGVLTKPDLVTEHASRETVKDLVLGRGKKLRLGYFIVKNRGADDQTSSLEERTEQEKAFFLDPKWREIAQVGKCGIGSLRARLSELLMELTKKELPNVRSDVVKKLDESRKRLVDIGPSRAEQTAQRMYIGNLVSIFQDITRCAMSGSYDSHAAFDHIPELKLITIIQTMNERFANNLWEHGHTRELSEDSDSEVSLHITAQKLSNLDLDEYSELHDIIESENYECPTPDEFHKDFLMQHIDKVYQSNRGAELGTFSGSILAITFKEQSEKWEPLVLAHVSNSIGVVHDYISKLLNHVCSDEGVRDRLWDSIILDELRKRYVQAMEHARFLLRIERDGMPSTYNHYFNSEVQRKRQSRMHALLKRKATSYYMQSSKSYESAIPVSQLTDSAVNKSNAEQVREDILDNLESYYKVSRKRFVDIICRQVIGYFLLEGEESPLNVLSPSLVHGLDTVQLEMIAGEDGYTKDQRALLELEIKNLEAAVKVLRG